MKAGEWRGYNTFFRLNEMKTCPVCNEVDLEKVWEAREVSIDFWYSCTPGVVSRHVDFSQFSYAEASPEGCVGLKCCGQLYLGSLTLAKGEAVKYASGHIRWVGRCPVWRVLTCSACCVYMHKSQAIRNCRRVLEKLPRPLLFIIFWYLPCRMNKETKILGCGEVRCSIGCGRRGP